MSELVEHNFHILVNILSHLVKEGTSKSDLKTTMQNLFNSCDRIMYARNIGIVAHVDAGKTTLTERILKYTGLIRKVGEVHDGGAKTDFLKQEQDRGITIQSAAISCIWKMKNEKYDINLIDTPGHIDFNIEVAKSLSALDGAILVIDGKEGVQTQTKQVVYQCGKYNVPLLCFINKMDGLGANFERASRTLGDKLGMEYLNMQIPVGQESGFMGVIDILEKIYYHWSGEVGAPYEKREVPADKLDELNEKYEELVENICLLDGNESLLAILEEEGHEKITLQQLRNAVREATISRKVVPVFCGSAYKNRGVECILDAVSHYLPNPIEMCSLFHEYHSKVGDVIFNPKKQGAKNAPIQVSENPDDIVAMVFDRMEHGHQSHMYFVRFYSGSLTSKAAKVYSSRTGKAITIRQKKKMLADEEKMIDNASFGDIIVIAGDETWRIGDTLTGINNKGAKLMGIEAPEPVISRAIMAKTKGQLSKLGEALNDICRKDISAKVTRDKDSGEIIISGMGDLHLEVIVETLREQGLDLIVGNPRVEFRETITRPVEKFVHEHKKQTGGSGQYAKIMFDLTSTDDGKVEFESKVVGGAIEKSYIVEIEKSFRNFVENTGGPNGYKIVGVKMTLLDGKMHEVDSSGMAFANATRYAMREAMEEGKSCVMEPIADVTIAIPKEYYRSIVGDVSSRRGIISGGMEDSTNDGPSVMKEISCQIPVMNMANYSTDLRGKTRGEGTYSMKLSHFSKLPSHIDHKQK